MTCQRGCDYGNPPPGPSGVLTADPSAIGELVTCPHCLEPGAAVCVTEGKWTNAGDGYAERIYRHDGCPAVDPDARSARPALLTVTTPRRPWWRRLSPRSH